MKELMKTYIIVTQIEGKACRGISAAKQEFISARQRSGTHLTSAKLDVIQKEFFQILDAKPNWGYKMLEKALSDVVARVDAMSPPADLIDIELLDDADLIEVGLDDLDVGDDTPPWGDN